jgi:hypothetical protein
MKSSDLRMGNVAHCGNGNYFKVTALKQKEIGFSILNTLKNPLPANWKAQPVKLTMDVVVNILGAEKIFSEKLKKHIFEITIGEYKIAFLSFGEVCYLNNVVPIKMEYLHHFQNLYYDLMHEHFIFDYKKLK